MGENSPPLLVGQSLVLIMEHPLSVFGFILLLALQCLEASVDENSLRNFVNITDYHRKITAYRADVQNSDSFLYRCKIDILSPVPGYQVAEITLKKNSP